MAIDADSLPLPVGVDFRDLAACAAECMKLLPKAFHGVRVVVRATAGHGIKPGARLRMWYWLSRPLLGKDLKAWLKQQGVDKKIIDGSVFSAAQFNFVADPIFEIPSHNPVKIGVRISPVCRR